jgi:hypothetical protein
MSTSSSSERNPFYADGITKVTDPFWRVICICGHEFLSCISNGKCPKCGGTDGVRMLGDRTYEEVVAERGEPVSVD